MIKRIDIFMPPQGNYGVLNHMTKEIHEAIKRQGVNSKLLVADYNNPKPFLESIFNDPPECTLSLNGLLPDSKGNFFCDMIKIPHIACLFYSPNQFVTLTRSSRNVITCPDLYATQFFKGLNAENVLFFPHGVSKEITAEYTKKEHEVVFLGSFIDYEANREAWKDKYPKEVCKALEQAAKTCFSEQNTPYVEAFVQALDQHISPSLSLDPNEFQLMQILDDLEIYIRGKDRVELIKSIKDAKVEIFGNGGDWDKYFTDENKNITCHGPIPFEEAIQVMQKSKIVLNSSAWIKNGGHERIFTGMAAGAVVVTSENPYMEESFKDGEDLIFYRFNQWDEINDKVNDLLKDDAKREKMAAKGRDAVMAAHTWDHRVKNLLEGLGVHRKELDH